MKKIYYLFNSDHTKNGDYMKNYSLWLDNIDNDSYPKLDSNLDVDILIIGGGITGISTLYHLINSNLKVCLVERNKIGEGITARTTGKLTYLQGNIYSKIKKMYSFNVARKYYEAQKDGIELVKNIIKNNNIECDFTRQRSFLFASVFKDIDALKQEKELIEKFGEKVSEIKIPLSINNYYAISVSNTYYFHPLKYVKKLAKICYKKGQNIYENTNIIKIEKNNNYYTCYTNEYTIKAKKIVIATHYPYFLKPFLFPLKCSLEKSYISASIIEDKKDISGINLNNRSISFRYYDKYFLYLNGTHNLCNSFNNKEKFNYLLKDNKDITFYWSNTDIITNDYLPYIGKIDNDMYLATGYNTWGMTNGSLAGKIISDLILYNNNKYKTLFNPKRNMAIYGKLNIIKDIYSSAKPFIQNKIFKNKRYYSNNVIFKKINGKDIGVYIDKEKKEHIVYNKCPHLKCSLIFNEVEHTWDCPCHASRFDIDGKCITGPSTKDITYKS